MSELCKITSFSVGNSFKTLIFNFELTLTLKFKMAPGGHLGIWRFCNLKTARSRAMCELCKITNFKTENSFNTLIFNFELTLTLKSKMAPDGHLEIQHFCNLNTTRSRAMCERIGLASPVQVSCSMRWVLPRSNSCFENMSAYFYNTAMISSTCSLLLFSILLSSNSHV